VRQGLFPDGAGRRAIRVLATDYDGTLARQGRVSVETVNELQRWKGAGGRIVLVTGRELEELRGVFPALKLCDRVIAENGAMLYSPATDYTEQLGDPAPKFFVEELRRRGVEPLFVGRSIVATVLPYDVIVRQVIDEQKLTLRIIMNKQSVMVLPDGIDKGSGLRAALAELEIDPFECVAVGDAENDIALFEAVGLGAAVANAIEPLQRLAQIRLAQEDGEGVCELIQGLLAGGP
jgi:hydroxymethylpyrimidine pyrophosphatase-like HAD family hydrolase